VGEWLETADKLGSIVGALVALLALTLERSRRRRSDSHAGKVLSVGAVGLALFSVVAALPTGLSEPARRWTAGSAAALALIAAGAAVAAGRRQRRLPARIIELIRAQQQRSTQHSYRYFDGHVPALTTVYVEQLMAGTDTARPAGRQEAHRILNDARPVVVIAAAGGGKSTLAATTVAETGDGWLKRSRPAGNRTVAIQLPAHDLAKAGSLSDALSTVSERDLRVPLDPQVFAAAPAAGATWTVLVDGLDEVRPAADRSTALWLIAQVIRARPPHLRLVILTRPLPDGELTELQNAGAVAYQLLPFDDELLTDFARRFFAAQLAADPAGEARQFVQQVRAAPFAPAVRTPLLATITALVYANDRGSPLPTSRYELFERFTAHLVHGRADLSETVRQLCQRLAKLGDEARGIERWLRSDSPSIVDRLLGELAEAKLDRSDTDAVEVAARWLRSHGPGDITAITGWAVIVGDLLAATGLLRHERRQLEFQHHSFVEFLSARRKAAGLSAEQWQRLAAQPADRGVALFAAARMPGIAGIMEELLRDGDAVLVGEVIAEGVPVTAELRRRTIDLLLDRVASEDDNAPECLRVLRQLPFATGVQAQLAELAADPAASPWSRVFVADALADTDPVAGTKLLQRLSVDGTLSLEVRRLAVMVMRRRGQLVPTSLEVTTSLEAFEEARLSQRERLGPFARDAALLPGAGHRDEAFELRLAVRHAQAGDFAALRAFATMDHRPIRLRIDAARMLASAGDVEALLAIAKDQQTLAWVRLSACRHPEILRRPETPELLRDFIADTRMGNVASLGAGRLLAELGDPSTLRLLSADPARFDAAAVIAAADLADRGETEPLERLATTNTGVDPHIRTLAAFYLAAPGLHGHGSAEVLKRQVNSRRLPWEARIRAAVALTSMNDPVGLERLRVWAGPSTGDGRVRALAAVQVGALTGDGSRLYALLYSPSELFRRIAMRNLYETLGDAAPLRACLNEPGAAMSDRLWAAHLLADDDALTSVATWAEDVSCPGLDRVAAADFIATRMPSRALSVLSELLEAADPKVSFAAAAKLLAHDPGVAIRWLRQTAFQPGATRYWRVRALVELAECGDRAARAALGYQDDRSDRIQWWRFLLTAIHPPVRDLGASA